MLQWLYNIKNGWYYLFLIVMSAVFVYLSNYFLTEILVYNVLGEQFTALQIQQLLGEMTKWQPLGYLLISLIVIIRPLFTAFCLLTGSLFQEYHWKWKNIFNISLKADIVFLFSQMCNFYYYVFVKDAGTLQDVNTNCLSLLNFTNKESVPAWLVSAYNSANLFEVLYIALLTVFIVKIFKLKWFKSLVFVLLTYGIGTYLYIAAMTFLYLNYM
jgi:hypothetical protein